MTPAEHSAARMNRYLSDVVYKDWVIDAWTDGSVVWITAQFRAGGYKWSSRRWLLDLRATKSEVIMTAFKAVLTAEEHEARETFKYRGKAIFGPHFDVEDLVEVAQ